MKRILFFAILFFPLLAFSQGRQDSVGVKTISSLTELTADIDTSYEVIFHDPSTGKISYRASVGEFLKTINALPSVIGTSQIINATIINEDISGSAAIALSKLENLTTNRLVGRDTTGAGIPESLTVGYGLRMGTDRIDIDTVSASGLVSKSRLTNALDDVSGGGSGTGNVSGREIQTLTADGTDTLNFAQKSFDYWQIDLSVVTSTSIVFSTPNDTIAPTYNLHFFNASTDTLNFASVFLDANKDTITQYIIEQGQIIPIYYDKNEDHYFTNYIELSVTDDQTAAEVSYTGNGQTTVQGALDSLFNGSGAIISAGTPTDASTPDSDVGSLLYDDNYLYVKTSAGWASTALTLVVGDTALTLNHSPTAYYLRGYGITSDVNGISQWNDRSGNGHHLTQGTDANKPALNGDGSVNFDGTNDFLTMPDFFSTSPDSVTIIAVLDRPADTTGLNYNVTTMEYVRGTGAGVINFKSGATFFSNKDSLLLSTLIRDGSPFVTAKTDTSYALGTKHVFVTRIAEGNQVSLQVNGTDDGSVAMSNYNGTTGNRRIGSDKDGSGTFFDGNFYLIAFYNKRLSDVQLSEEVTKINNYFNINQ